MGMDQKYCMKYSLRLSINIFLAVLKKSKLAQGVGMFNDIVFTYEYGNMHVFS